MSRPAVSVSHRGASLFLPGAFLFGRVLLGSDPACCREQFVWMPQKKKMLRRV